MEAINDHIKAKEDLQAFLIKTEEAFHVEHYDNGNSRYKIQKKVDAVNHLQIFLTKDHNRYSVQVTSGLIGKGGSSWYFQHTYDLVEIEKILKSYDIVLK